jgi:hypothetical protein
VRAQNKLEGKEFLVIQPWDKQDHQDFYDLVGDLTLLVMQVRDMELLWSHDDVEMITRLNMERCRLQIKLGMREKS